MAFDFANISKLFKHVDAKTLGKVLKFYKDNEEIVDFLVATTLKTLSGIGKEEPKPVIPDEHPVNPGTPAVPNPDPDPNQVYFTLKAEAFFVEDDRQGGPRGRILTRPEFEQILSSNGPGALMVGQRMHINITPYDRAGREIRPDDPRHPGIPGTREENQYTMDYEWRVNGKVATNSKEISDPFELESSWDDFGMTPTLLNSEAGVGRQKVEFVAWIKPEYNGGAKVLTNVLVFYKD